MRRAHRVFVACLLIVGLGCQREVTPQVVAAEAEAPASAGARFVVAESAQGSTLFDAPARVLATPEDSAVISAPLPLRVTRVRVRPGQLVKRNEPLIDVAMPELIRAVGAHNAAELRIAGYEARRARLLPLVAEGLARAADAADLEAQIALARADLESAHAVLRSAGVPETVIPALIAHSGSMPLVAPIDGVVVAVAARLGAMWEPPDGPLVELAQAESALVEARFHVPPPDDMRFEWQGTGASVALTLERVSPRALAEDGSRVVWFSIPDAPSRLVPGEIGRVRALPSHLWAVVPKSAVTRDDGGSVVHVESDAGTRAQSVSVLLASTTEAVVSGIAPGTRVLAVAAQREADKP